MLKFDEKDYMSGVEKTQETFKKVEQVTDRLIEEGINNIFFISSGGSVAQMQPLHEILKKNSSYQSYIEVAGDVVLTGHKHLQKGSLVLMASKTGDTKETVEAARFCKNKSASILSFVKDTESPLAKNSDYVIEMPSDYGEHTLLNYYVLIYRLMYKNDEYTNYNQLIEQFRLFTSNFIKTIEHFEIEASEIARNHHNDNYQIWIGSGTMWGTVYLFSMCILEEMQWIRTKSVTSSEFFHGTLELVDENVPVFLVKNLDETKPLDDRVEKFINRYTNKGVVFDPAKYKLSEIDNKVHAIVTPIIMSALLKRLAFHFEKNTGHDLNYRRYYRKLDF